MNSCAASIDLHAVRTAAFVSGIVLNLLRQRAREFHAFAGVLDDHRRRTEADFPALSLADMVENGGEIGIACRFGCQLRGDAEPVEKRLEISSGRGLVVNQRLGAEQGLLEFFDGGDLWQRRAFAHQNADADSAQCDRLPCRDFADFTSCSSTLGGAITTSTVSPLVDAVENRRRRGERDSVLRGGFTR